MKEPAKPKPSPKSPSARDEGETIPRRVGRPRKGPHTEYPNGYKTC